MKQLNHVAFIMDGNRRFAKRLLKEPWLGHEQGTEKFKEVLNWLKEHNIPEATFYTFSTENFNRPKNEFDFLMNLFIKFHKEFIEEKFAEKNDVKFELIGDQSKFPQEVQDALNDIVKSTAQNSGHVIRLAFGYGGRQEVTQAIQTIAKQVESGNLSPENIDESFIEKHLYTTSQPDLIIRTGGEVRTSNFLIWQAAYSEWYFCDKMWPEFNKDDFEVAIKNFEERQRRFGK